MHLLGLGIEEWLAQTKASNDSAILLNSRRPLELRSAENIKKSRLVYTLLKLNL